MGTNTDEAKYLEAVVQQKPRKDDEREVAITAKIAEQMLQKPWAREAVTAMRDLQIAYMREVIARIDDPAWVYKRTQEVLKEISRLSRAKIAEGAEFLKDIPKGRPALIVTNHLGLYKLAGIDPKKELGIDIAGYDFMYPSPMYFGGLSPVAETLGNKLSYVSNDFPGIFGKIHSESGFVHVPPKGPDKTGRTGILLEQTEARFDAHPDTAMVNFPEGGTSGKYSGLGPYDTDPFKTGGYAIAGALRIRIIPVAQYWDPEKGLQLKVFPSYVPDASGDKAANQALADRDRKGMQDWFDSLGVSSRSAS